MFFREENLYLRKLDLKINTQNVTFGSKRKTHNSAQSAVYFHYYYFHASRNRTICQRPKHWSSNHTNPPSVCGAQSTEFFELQKPNISDLWSDWRFSLANLLEASESTTDSHYRGRIGIIVFFTGGWTSGFTGETGGLQADFPQTGGLPNRRFAAWFWWKGRG